VNPPPPQLPRNLLALLSGLLAGAAFPPSPLHSLGLVALLPLYFALDDGRRGFRRAFLAGLVYNLLTVYWIGYNSDPSPALAWASMAGAVCWLSLLWGLAGGLATFLVRRIGPAALWCHPFAVTALDWIVESSEMGFPWNLLGATQAESQFIKPLAALGGMHAMTLAVLLLSKLLHSWWRWRLLRGRAEPSSGNPPGLLGGLVAQRHPLLLALWFLSVFSLGRAGQGDVRPSGRVLDVLIVQGNVDPHEKWSRPYQWTVDRHLALSRAALGDTIAPDLVIWPETAVPTRLRRRPALILELQAFCREFDTALLAGANDLEIVEGAYKPLNASFLLTEDGIVDHYSKVRLVPFGERVPGQKLLPWLGGINMGQAEFAAGRRRSPGCLPSPSGGDSLCFSWSICFEANFGGLAREMVRGGAQVLTNQTNDAWFGLSRELDQHLAVASLRCVETGRCLVRSANNGYSAVIDPRGEIRELLPKGEGGALRAEVPLYSGFTFHTRFGDLLPRLCLLLLSWALLLSLLGGRSRRLSLPGGRGSRKRRREARFSAKDDRGQGKVESGEENPGNLPSARTFKGGTLPACLLGLAICLAPAATARDLYHGAGTAAARVLSMGGCYAANSRYADAHLYNPAALRSDGQGFSWLLLCDPLSPALARELSGQADGAYEGLVPGILFLRGLYFGLGPVNLGLIPAEYSPSEPADLSETAREAVLERSGLSPGAALSLVLDRKVSLGISAMLRWDPEGARRRVALDYGVLVRANNWMDVGAVAVHLPKGGEDLRRSIERIGDETINVGILYYPLGRPEARWGAKRIPAGSEGLLARTDLRLAMDVRNVTQSPGLARAQELHLGMSLGWIRLLELRCGIYWPRGSADLDKRPRASCGLGLGQPWFLRSAARGLGLVETFLDLGWMDDPEDPGRGIWMGTFKWAF